MVVSLGEQHKSHTQTLGGLQEEQATHRQTLSKQIDSIGSMIDSQAPE